jgi:hypothetical protein
VIAPRVLEQVAQQSAQQPRVARHFGRSASPDLDLGIDPHCLLGSQTGKVDRLAEKTDSQTAILERLETGAKQLASNPKVQLLAGLLWTALLTWLAGKGLVTK